MSRCMLVLDLQGDKVPAMVTQQIENLSGQLPTVVSTQIEGGEALSSLVAGEQSFSHHGLQVSADAIQYIRSRNFDEVLIVGGFMDAKLVAACIALHDGGLKPIIISPLCYGNLWYEHSVTLRMLESEVGAKVYQSAIEAGVSGL